MYLGANNKIHLHLTLISWKRGLKICYLWRVKAQAVVKSPSRHPETLIFPEREVSASPGPLL